MYLILSIIQGFTEPIPISSSGHLLILKSIFHISYNDFNFEIIVNFGSLLAIILYFKNDIINLIKNSFTFIRNKDTKYKSDFNYILFVIVGTIPAGILGILFKEKIELIFSNVKFIGFSLIITALFLSSIKHKNGSKKLNFKEAFIIGLFQAIALLPGISRSGATIFGGLYRDLKKEDVFKFSFMLYIPISLFSLLSLNHFNLIYVLYIFISFIFTYISIKFFFNIIKKQKLIYFSIYCFFIGALVLIFM